MHEKTDIVLCTILLVDEEICLALEEEVTMRTAKDINWLHVDFASYSIKDYYEDIPFIKVASNYVKLSRDDEVKTLYKGEFFKNGVKHTVKLNIDLNDCRVDDEYFNPETFIGLFEGEEVDPIPIIKELTGIDHEDYCTKVQYSDGTTELLEVKGKCLLLFGTPKSGQCDDEQ